MKTPDGNTVVSILAGMLLLTIVTWLLFGASSRRLQQPAAPGPAQSDLLDGTPMNRFDHTPHATHGNRGKSRQGAAKQVDSTDPGSFEDPYHCVDDCPPGYDIFNTTGTEEEARWMHAAGFPTPAEYESLTRDEAALAEGRRRALAGDARAAGILAAYYLEQKDYSETLKMAVHGIAGCNVYALRVDAQLSVQDAEGAGAIGNAATDLQVAYLLGDQDAALELGSLLRATNAGREVIGTLTHLVMRDAAARLNGFRQLNPVACQYPGLRPTPG